MVVCEMGWGGVGWGSVFRHFTFFFSSFFDVDPSTRSVFFSLVAGPSYLPSSSPFFYPDPWQQQHLAYWLTSEPPPHAVCSQNLLEPQPEGTAAMVAAQS